MKKLAIVLVALLLACVFVGCGAANMLKGTQWYEVYTYGGVTYKETWSFEDENVFKFTKATLENSGLVNDPETYEGTWSTEGVDILVTDISGQGGVTGKWTVAFDEEDKNILVLTRESDSKVVRLNRVTEE